jgi:transcriptional regulator with XRE-family HTH domain
VFFAAVRDELFGDRRERMGRRPRKKQQHLAKKLLRIRDALGLSQIQLVKSMGIETSVSHHRISEYESGRREPSLSTLLAYGRIAAVHLEEIVDDELELPDKLPGNVRYRRPTEQRPLS